MCVFRIDGIVLVLSCGCERHHHAVGIKVRFGCAGKLLDIVTQLFDHGKVLRLVFGWAPAVFLGVAALAAVVAVALEAATLVSSAATAATASSTAASAASVGVVISFLVSPPLTSRTPATRVPSVRVRAANAGDFLWLFVEHAHDLFDRCSARRAWGGVTVHAAVACLTEVSLDDLDSIFTFFLSLFVADDEHLDGIKLLRWGDEMGCHRPRPPNVGTAFEVNRVNMFSQKRWLEH